MTDSYHSSQPYCKHVFADNIDREGFNNLKCSLCGLEQDMVNAYPPQYTGPQYVTLHPALKRAYEDARDFGNGFLMIDSDGSLIRVDPHRIKLTWTLEP